MFERFPRYTVHNFIAMGQYYIAVFMRRTRESPDAPWTYTIVGSLNPWAFGCLGKLMEHSYVCNPFVTSASSLLCKEGGFPASEVCLAWAGDYADGEPDTDKNLYSASKDCADLAVVGGIRMSKYPYLLNHDKRSFVCIPYESEHRVLHPLPILTAEGNGRGGGDLPQTHPWAPFVGTWARDVLSLSDSRPPDGADWTELILPVGV